MNAITRKTPAASTVYGLLALGGLIFVILYGKFGISQHDVGPLAAIPLLLFGGGFILFFTLLFFIARVKEDKAAKEKRKAGKK